MKVLASSLVVSCALLGAFSAAAYSDGQTGYTGRVDGASCLQCHGAKQYPGLTVKLDTPTTTSCWVDRNGTLEELKLPTLTFGQTVNAIVEIPTPSGADVPVCPTNDCCAAEAPGAGEADQACIDRGIDIGTPGCSADNHSACCAPGLATCDEPVAGFNAEVVGGGKFAAAEGTRLLIEGGEENGREITHNTPARFAGGFARWSFPFTAPSAEEAPANGLEIWTGANVANGNGREDPLDLNSNHRLDVVLSDGTAPVSFPGYCAVCSNGELSVNGQCCTCVTAKPGAGTFGFLGATSALAFLLLGRRRRRR